MGLAAILTPDEPTEDRPCHTERVTRDVRTFEGRLRVAIGDRPVDRVAREAGVGRRTLRDLLLGVRKRGAYSGTIELLAEHLSVSPAWLQYGVTAVSA